MKNKSSPFKIKIGVVSPFYAKSPCYALNLLRHQIASNSLGIGNPREKPLETISFSMRGESGEVRRGPLEEV